MKFSYGRNPGAVFLEKTPTEYFEDSILNKIYLIGFFWNTVFQLDWRRIKGIKIQKTLQSLGKEG